MCLADLFGIATGAAGACEPRQGIDLLGMLGGKAKPRERPIGYYAEPGTIDFKIMVRNQRWKYIFLANGGRQQLFDMQADPQELDNRAAAEPAVVRTMSHEAVSACRAPGMTAALNGDELRALPLTKRPLQRVYQFDHSRGVVGFPQRPEGVLIKTHPPTGKALP